MLHAEAEQALARLQSQASKATELYTSDLLDRAMDEVVRNPENSRPAPFQVRSAKANAAKVLAARRRLAPRQQPLTASDENDEAVESGAVDPAFAVFELRHWLLTTTGLTRVDRRILCDLWAGHNASSLAQRDGLPIGTVRALIASARARGQRAFLFSLSS